MQALAVAEFPQLAAAVWGAPDRGAAAIPVTPGQVALVVLATLGQDAVATLVTLDQDVHNQEAPGLDARRSGGHTLDLPEAAVQSLDPLVEKVQLVAKFPVGERWEALPSREVLEVLDQDVRHCRLEVLDRDAPVDREALDQAAPVALVTYCQDVRHCRIHRMEVPNNTRFLF